MSSIIHNPFLTTKLSSFDFINYDNSRIENLNTLTLINQISLLYSNKIRIKHLKTDQNINESFNQLSEACFMTIWQLLKEIDHESPTNFVAKTTVIFNAIINNVKNNLEHKFSKNSIIEEIVELGSFSMLLIDKNLNYCIFTNLDELKNSKNSNFLVKKIKLHEKNNNENILDYCFKIDDKIKVNVKAAKISNTMSYLYFITIL